LWDFCNCLHNFELETPRTDFSLPLVVKIM
jgi:hypothetical protein